MPYSVQVSMSTAEPCCVIGLKPALTKVADYNRIMKDFPVNDLLSATELEEIPSALVAIFLQFSKIYPLPQALLQAVCRDFSSVMLTLLGTRRLMQISFDDFEKVSICFGVTHF